MSAKRVRLRTICEFAVHTPNVQTADGVDIQRLHAGDASPYYVTLPIVPEVGVVSGNGLLYDETLVAALEMQINRKRPGGNFGHVENAYQYPHPAAFWVGARRDGQTLWAKAYIMPGPAREHLRAIEAVQGSISTSILGVGEEIAVDDETWRMADFELETVDFAPPERSALGYSAPVRITAEIIGESGGNDMPTKQEIIDGLTVADVPDALRRQIEGAAQARVTELRKSDSQLRARIAELMPIADNVTAEQRAGVVALRELAAERAIGMIANENVAQDTAITRALETVTPALKFVRGSADAAPGDAVAELRGELAEWRSNAIRSRVNELAATDIAAEALRPVIVDAVMARNPGNIAEAEQGFKTVIESDHIKRLLEMDLQQAMGPAQTTATASQNGQPTANFMTIPADED